MGSPDYGQRGGQGGAWHLVVRFSTFGSLRRYLPQDDDPLDVELPEIATVADLAAQLGITWGELGIIQINGQLAGDDTLLRDGDLVEVFAPLGGG